MKTFMTAVALATLVASTAFAQTATGPSSNQVIVNGQVVGQDPDPNIRFQLLREYPFKGGE